MLFGREDAGNVDRCERFYCVTFDFSNQFLTTNFCEFRKEITISHPSAIERAKKCTACSQNARGAVRIHALFLEEAGRSGKQPEYGK